MTWPIWVDSNGGSIGSSFTALDMEGVAKRAAFAILEREFPREFDQPTSQEH